MSIWCEKTTFSLNGSEADIHLISDFTEWIRHVHPICTHNVPYFPFQKHTTGTNCEVCEAGWYRPYDVRPDDPEPCLACDCHPDGSDGNVCLPDKDTVSETRYVITIISLPSSSSSTSCVNVFFRFFFPDPGHGAVQLPERIRRRQVQRMRSRLQRVPEL